MAEVIPHSKAKYSRAQVTTWLSWLARNMQAQGQTVFLIEELQDSWLSSEAEKKMAWTLHNNFLLLILIFCFAPILAEDEGLIRGLLYTGLGLLLFPGLIGAILLYLSSKNSWIIAKQIERANDLYKNIYKIPGGENIESWSWSWNHLSSNYRGALKAGGKAFTTIFVIAFFFGILISLSTREGDFFYALRIGLFLGVMAGLVAGLIRSLSIGLKSRVSSHHTKPNEGIKATRRIALGAGMFISSVIVMIIIIISWRSSGIKLLILWPILAFLVSQFFGGLTVLRHYALRLLIYYKGYGPWNYAEFLDYCADELQFLQKVGGGYMFIHRHLLEYFAEIDQE